MTKKDIGGFLVSVVSVVCVCDDSVLEPFMASGLHLSL